MQVRSTWLFALPVSVLCVALLLCVLALNLVHEPFDPRVSKPVSWDVSVTRVDEAAQTRKRLKPEPPEPVEAEVRTTVLQPATPVQIESEMPSLQLDIEMPSIPLNELSVIELPAIEQSAIEQSATTAPSGAVSAGVDIRSLDIQPTQKTPPRYPAQALRRNIEGMVKLTFTINKQGRAEQITVVEANPRRVFEREAIRALKSWRFPVYKLDGRAINVPNQVQIIEFKLQ